ncbi:hypothetical protein LOTGIDRAFT_176721 [Lottia gigantea]|uniref:Uncharacterized protein n=1 Tax=Lottia gigantea TaxID=225164 RepID=V3ZSK1_LOTGI|nr:hypothetical protein LOTGIDRAFT_176721 [Lottia gigantea]ESO94418.1 hypothetical protein LOTGIDRAFT_176721 [Lottia gigantea]
MTYSRSSDYHTRTEITACDPINKNLQTRTGKNVRAGKVIRVDKNGFENFDDYFGGNISGSDSSINITLDHTLHTNKNLLQNSSDDSKTKGKKLTTKKTQKSTNKGDRNAIFKLASTTSMPTPEESACTCVCLLKVRVLEWFEI